MLVDLNYRLTNIGPSLSLGILSARDFLEDSIFSLFYLHFVGKIAVPTVICVHFWSEQSDRNSLCVMFAVKFV